MKKITLLIIFFCIAGCSGKNFQPFSKTDWALQTAYTTAAIYDWRQTLEIKNHPELIETNPFLGRNPTDQEINTMIPVGILAHWLFAWYLPPEGRKIFQTTFIGIEGAAVRNNYKNGIRVD